MTSLNNNHSNKKTTDNTKILIAALLICCSSFMFGYALSSLNSCLVLGDANNSIDCYNNNHHNNQNNNNNVQCPKGTIYNSLKLNALEASIATSLTVLGAWMGSMNGSQPSELYGRKKTLLYNNILFIIGTIFAASGNLILLYLGRLFIGFGVGITSVVAPVLLAEIANNENRGIITTLFQLILTIGIFTASITAYGFVNYVNNGWQYVQMFGGVPAVIMIIFHFYIPESPKWLLLHNNRDAAVNVLISVRDYGDDMNLINNEIEQIQNGLNNSDSNNGKLENSNSNNNNEITWSEVFVWKHAVIIGCGLMFIQALSGINSVIFYSTTIFGFAGFNESILATASVGAVNVLTTVLATYIVDTMGRKTLLISGTSIMFIALMVLSMVLWTGDNLGKSTQGIIAVISVLIYIFGFAIGLGAVCWVVMSEIMPTRLRTKAVSLFLSINWGSNLIIGLLTLTAIDSLGGVKHGMTDDEVSDAEKIGVAKLYFIFAMITAAGFLFIYFYVPETRGKTPEEIMAKMNKKNGINYEPLLEADIVTEKSYQI